MNSGIKFFDKVLFWGGLLVFLFVIVISWKQFSHHKMNIGVSGVELTTGNRYGISGFIRGEGVLHFPKNNLSLIEYPKALPFVGSFGERNGIWFFKLSKNVFSAKKDDGNNILLPKVHFKGKTANNQIIEPNSEITEATLLEEHIVFIDRANGMILLELWMEKEEGKKVLRSSTLVSSSLNLQNNGNLDSIKLIESEGYRLKDTDPTKLLLLPGRLENVSNEQILKIERINANKYWVNIGEEEYKISRNSNQIFWNGWLLKFKGFYSWEQILTLFFAFLFGISAFVLIYKKFVIADDSKNTRLIETRVLRMLMVYILFSVLSIIFINHQWLSNEYTRGVGFPVMLFVMVISWWATIIAISDIQKNAFLEGKVFPNKNWYTFELGNYHFRKFIVFWVLTVLAIFAFWHRTNNERVILMGGLGIPVLHLSKIVVCLIVYLFRKVLFKGDLCAHGFLWSIVILNALLTGDFSSLIFSIASYIAVSFFLTGKLVLPNLYRLRGWWKFYKSQNDEIPSKLLAGHFTLFSYLGIVIGVPLVSLLGHITKAYRFFLPYISPDAGIFIDLNNQHKETYANMFWTVDYVLNNLSGTWADFRTVNFFTTWHTDLAILSWLQYGGILVVFILTILVGYLLYDMCYQVIGIRRIINIDIIEKLEEAAEVHKYSKAHQQVKIIYENIFIYFLSVYLIIQTVYPFFSNLNLLPMIGTPVPCLSVSVVEYVLTPVFLIAIYFYTGRLIHHNELILPEKYGQREEKVRGVWFQKSVLKGISKKSFVICFLLFILFGLGLLIKVNFCDKEKYSKNSYSLLYNTSKNETLNEILNEVNNLNLKDKDAINQQLVIQANKSLLNFSFWENKFKNGDRNKREIISEVRKFIFSDDYLGLTEIKPSIVLTDSSLTLEITNNSLMKKRKVYKSNTISNLSYKDYFTEKSSAEIGNMDYTTDTRVVMNNDKLFINSSNLEDFSNNFIVSSKRNNLPNSEYLYDGVANKIIYKIVNGNKVKVLAYPSVGDIDLTSDTFDADLQAIITLYLERYLQKDPVKMKVASVVIAENKTGFVNVLASAPNFQNSYGKLPLKKFKDIQKVETYFYDKAGNRSLDKISLISWFDEDNKNFALAQAMPGSTVKPIYTFTALANPEFNFLSSSTIRQFIRSSNSKIAVDLFRNQYKNDLFQKNLYNYFNIKMFDDVQYRKMIKDSTNYLANTGSVIAGAEEYGDLWRYRKNGSLSDIAIRSAAWGQGSINLSLTTLVRDYIRINERVATVLKLHRNDSYQAEGDGWPESSRIQSLYEGMSLVISSGTAASTVGKVLNKYKYNTNDFKGKTGTAQFPENTELGRQKNNKSAYMMLITPSHTIGISLFGILPNAGRSDESSELIHARGIAVGLIDIMHHWRGGLYLKTQDID